MGRRGAARPSPIGQGVDRYVLTLSLLFRAVRLRPSQPRSGPRCELNRRAPPSTRFKSPSPCSWPPACCATISFRARTSRTVCARCGYAYQGVRCSAGGSTARAQGMLPSRRSFIPPVASRAYRFSIRRTLLPSATGGSCKGKRSYGDLDPESRRRGEANPSRL